MHRYMCIYKKKIYIYIYMYIEGMNKEMHAKSGMHKPRYTQRKRQSNI